MFSTQAMVIIWGDGVANYIIMVIISQYTSNHHVVHLKPAQWYMSYVSVQPKRKSRSKPNFAENPPFFFSFQSRSDRKAAIIHIFHKQKISLGILWKGHFSWSFWFMMWVNTKCFDTIWWGPWIFSDQEYTALSQVLMCSLILDHHAGRIMWLRTVIAVSGM